VEVKAAAQMGAWARCQNLRWLGCALRFNEDAFDVTRIAGVEEPRAEDEAARWPKGVEAGSCTSWLGPMPEMSAPKSPMPLAAGSSLDN